ncbi:hypothetical protein ACHAO3_004499 [Verticillium nonalfalfae]
MPSQLEDLRKASKISCDTLDVQGIVDIFSRVDPTFDTKRVCVKIPGTFEGIGACRILENDDIPANRVATLATTLFCMEQAVLAANARCTYIAPYVNELKVHFEPG